MDEASWAFVWKWIERAAFDGMGARACVDVLIHYPGAPWETGEWDVTHKSYAEAFYEKFPQARPGSSPDRAETPQSGSVSRRRVEPEKPPTL